MIWKQNTELSQYNLFRENGYSAFSAVALCKAGIKTLDAADEFCRCKSGFFLKYAGKMILVGKSAL